MRETRTIVYPEIGEVEFRRSLRAKRLSISVRPVRNVRVVLPIGVSFSVAEKFVQTKRLWILDHLRRLENRIPEVPVFGENQPIKTRYHTLELCAVHRINEKIDIEVREFLPKRVDELSRQFDFQYTGLRVKNQKTRWGSCSSRNYINLNLQLMRLPDHLIDYVILHELTHTKVKNHSATFWLELARVFPQYQKARQEMKRYAIGF